MKEALEQEQHEMPNTTDAAPLFVSQDQEPRRPELM
jgi:hypothetical protein